MWGNASAAGWWGKVNVPFVVVGSAMKGGREDRDASSLQQLKDDTDTDTDREALKSKK